MGIRENYLTKLEEAGTGVGETRIGLEADIKDGLRQLMEEYPSDAFAFVSKSNYPYFNTYKAGKVYRRSLVNEREIIQLDSIDQVPLSEYSVPDLLGIAKVIDQILHHPIPKRW